MKTIRSGPGVQTYTSSSGSGVIDWFFSGPLSACCDLEGLGLVFPVRSGISIGIHGTLAHDVQEEAQF